MAASVAAYSFGIWHSANVISSTNNCSSRKCIGKRRVIFFHVKTLPEEGSSGSTAPCALKPLKISPVHRIHKQQPCNTWWPHTRFQHYTLYTRLRQQQRCNTWWPHTRFEHYTVYMASPATTMQYVMTTHKILTLHRIHGFTSNNHTTREEQTQTFNTIPYTRLHQQQPGNSWWPHTRFLIVCVCVEVN